MLHRFKSCLTCSDLHNVLDVINKDFSVANVTCIKRPFCGVNYLADGNGADHNVNLNLRQKIGFNLNTAVIFGLAL